MRPWPPRPGARSSDQVRKTMRRRKGFCWATAAFIPRRLAVEFRSRAWGCSRCPSKASSSSRKASRTGPMRLRGTSSRLPTVLHELEEFVVGDHRAALRGWRVARDPLRLLAGGTTRWPRPGRRTLAQRVEGKVLRRVLEGEEGCHPAGTRISRKVSGSRPRRRWFSAGNPRHRAPS